MFYQCNWTAWLQGGLSDHDIVPNAISLRPLIDFTLSLDILTPLLPPRTYPRMLLFLDDPRLLPLPELSVLIPTLCFSPLPPPSLPPLPPTPPHTHT